MTLESAIDELESPPLVSVVIPAFNASRTIDRTLRSVSAQTYPNLEVIVVDDGSTDETADIVATLARQDGRIRLVRKPNGGVASARNCGMREARGRYFAPIDADDVWLPENLYRQVAALEAGGPTVSFCFAGSFIIDEFDRKCERARPMYPLPADYISLLRRNWVGNGSAAVFRREALLSIGGYDETLRARSAQGAEDWKVVLQLAAKGPGVSVVGELIGYRKMPNSMSTDLISMTRSTLIVINEIGLLDPKKAPWHFWHARTRINIGMFYLLVYAGHWAEALWCLVMAYVANPLWFTQKVARDFLFKQLIPHVVKRAAALLPMRGQRANGSSDGL